MALKIGDVAPDFEAETTQGRIKFHDWIGDSWAVLFSHPKDFTPVCTTELGYMAKIQPDFESRNVKIIGLSVDPLDKHEGWAKDIEETQGAAPNYPIISDADFNISKLYGMLPADVSGDPGERTPADNQTVRNVFVVGPDKKIKLILVYPMTTGRNFDEVLRVIDSLQLTAKHKVATPAQWQQGDDVIIAGSVSNDEAKETYPEGWEEPRRVRVQVELGRAGDAADEGVDAVAGDKGRGRRQSAAQLDRGGVEPDLLVRLAQCRRRQVGVPVVLSTAGERDLAGVAAQVGAALSEDQPRFLRPPVERQQHGSVGAAACLHRGRILGGEEQLL